MPIRRELRWFYPLDWPQISQWVRFARARGRCERCKRPHGHKVVCLPDGRWFDAEARVWRTGRGRAVRPPQARERAHLKSTAVVLAAAHRDHDPGHCRPRNLLALCQRCHLIHDRPYHLARRRLTYLRRRAVGDLFLGPYRSW